MKILEIVLLFGILVITNAQDDQCLVSPDKRKECGYIGISQAACVGKGCCYLSSDSVNLPWCFHKNVEPEPTCAIDDKDKKECGYYGIKQEDCLKRNCCWEEVSPAYPWCFKKKENPTPEMCDIPDLRKKECGYSGMTSDECKNKGCCWVSAKGFPACYFKKETPEECKIEVTEREICGAKNITQEECLNKECCWEKSKEGPSCYKAKEPAPEAECPYFKEDIDGPGFTYYIAQKMKSYFYENINIFQQGGVVVAHSHDERVSNDKFYHRVRDAALAMESYIIMNYNIFPDVNTTFVSYLSWLNRTEHNTSLSANISVEPRFELPYGELYDKSYPRPQVDGPSLRALTIARFISIVPHRYEEERERYCKMVELNIKNIIKTYNQTGYNIWEEHMSNKLFWTGMITRKALLYGTSVCPAAAEEYKANITAIVKEIEAKLEKYFDGIAIKEEGETLDSSVLAGIVFGYNDDSFYDPSDLPVLKTLDALSKMFCKYFEINKKDSLKNITGVLFGKNEDDKNLGRQASVFATALAANVYYIAADKMLDKKLSVESLKEYSKLLKVDVEFSKNALLGKKNNIKLASSFLVRGDSIMQRIYQKTIYDNFHLYEEIDDVTGTQCNSKDSTLSYSEVLRALSIRKVALEKINTLKSIM